MKIQKLYKTLFFIIFIIITASCSKQDDYKTEATFTNPYEEVGKMHNEDLQYILENLDLIPEKSQTRIVVEQLLNNKYTLKSGASVSIADVPGFPEDMETFDVYTWLEEFNISEALKQEFIKTFDMFKSNPPLDDMIREIELRELDAENLFEGDDLRIYYEHLAVAKYSPQFWLPEEQGGMNGLDFLNTGLKTTSKTMGDDPLDLWKVFACDCVGGVAGGPVGYVAASAISTIMQL